MRALKRFGMGKYGGVIALAVAIMLVAPAAPALGGENDGRRSPVAFFGDAWTSMTIESAYAFDKKLNTFDVDVEVKRGVVSVIGYVYDAASHDRAIEIANDTRGVKKVLDKLIVDPDYKTKLAKGQLFEQGIDDHWMSRKVKAKLIADPKVTGTWIGVEAEDGVVTLRGSVYEFGEIEKARDAAAGVSGVTEVKNMLVCCRM